MKKILNPYLNKEGYNCVCCAPNNPVGLHLEFWEEGEDVLTIWNPGENYQGWINTLHGGIISMLMDEVAGWVINRKLQTTGVTMQLNVKYKKPVMTTDSQITVRGHIASQRRNIVTIHRLWRTPKARFVMRAKPSTSPLVRQSQGDGVRQLQGRGEE